MTINKNIDALNIEAFDKYKKGKWDVHIFDTCVSTIDEAKKVAQCGAKHGDLVISRIQEGGRGRQARQWISPDGGVWMSIVLKPKLEIYMLSPITLLCAVAVAKAIEEIFPKIKPTIKWPNDIYIQSKKICGILSETCMQSTKVDSVVVGIGINANNTTEHFDDEIKSTAISFAELGIVVNRAQLASKINDTLLQLVSQYSEDESIEFIMDYYTKRMHWLGKEAAMKNTATGEIAQRGIIKGIDKQGQLLMEIDGQLTQIVSGELSLRSI